MTRYRITVRADNVELRGYFDGDEDTLREFAQNMAPVGVVVASVAEDGFDPFAITEPENPPTMEKSREIITGIGMAAASMDDFVELVALLHYNQALVIRGERARANKAEAKAS